MTKANSKTTAFEIVAPDYEHAHVHCTTQGMFGGSTFFVGGGKEHYVFLSLKQLETNCMAVVDGGNWSLPDVRLTKGKHFEIDLGVLRHFDDRMTKTPPKMIRFIKAAAPTKKTTDERLMANDLQNVMVEDLFEQPVHAFFERDLATLVEDKLRLPPEYHEVADSLRDQLLPAQEQVIAALPKVMAQLRLRYADASTGQLFQGALQLIGQQLSPILSTIQMWTTGFRQSLDPALKDKLRIVRAIIESNLFLALTGNLKLDELQSNDEIKQLIPTINVSVGDVVLPVLIGPFDSGPAVIPMASGALGPRGGHLAFIPWNLLKVLPFIIPIYAHETGHLLQGVIVDYMETYSKLAVATIQNAIDGGLKLDEDTIMIGNTKVPARTFWPLVFMGQLPEQDADNWGIRASGPAAFIRSFIIYVAAMTGVAVGDLDKVDHVLRSSSSWTPVQTKDGKTQIRLEPHPQDNPRIGSWDAAIAREMGYVEEADYATAFAASESGTPVPTHMTWVGQMPRGGDQDDDSLVEKKTTVKKATKAKAKPGTSKSKAPTKRKAPSKTKPEADEAKTDSQPTAAPKPSPKQPQLPTISASIADYDKLARLVVQAFLDTETDCLNRMTLRKLVNLSPKMHIKVDDVRSKLRNGDGKLSEKYHTFPLTVGSAFVEEYVALVAAGGKPTEVREQLMKPAMEMLLAITDQWEADVKRLDVYKLNSKDVQPKPLRASKKN